MTAKCVPAGRQQLDGPGPACCTLHLGSRVPYAVVQCRRHCSTHAHARSVCADWRPSRPQTRGVERTCRTLSGEFSCLCEGSPKCCSGRSGTDSTRSVCNLDERLRVQIEGFKKALSRGGGANRFLRFLSRKAKDGASAASADTITLDDMLTFSPVRYLSR